MSAYGHGRHEHGQNFLTNHKIINSIIDLVKQTSGPIIEIGPGSGALTHPMAHLGRAITAVEVDAKLAAKITQETSSFLLPELRRGKPLSPFSTQVRKAHHAIHPRIRQFPACGKHSLSPHHCHSSKVAACASMD